MAEGAKQSVIRRCMTGVTLYAVHLRSSISYGYAVCRALHSMAGPAYLIVTGTYQVFLRRSMRFMAGRTFTFLKRHMDMRVLKPLAQGGMAIPAQVFLALDQKLRIFSAVTVMAVGARSLP